MYKENKPIFTIDFETRSECDLNSRGIHNYSTDCTTKILCLAYKSCKQKEVHFWTPDLPEFGSVEQGSLKPLLEHIAQGGLVEAHNMLFEYFIWHEIGVTQHGFPPIPLKQWRCSLAKACANARPRSLANLAIALKTDIQKDAEGNKAMLKICKPWRGEFINDIELLNRTIKYCKIDVLTEEMCSHLLPDLTPQKLNIWLMTQKMNIEGLPLDLELIKSAIKLEEEYIKHSNKRFFELTGIDRSSKRIQVKKFILDKYGIDLPNTTKSVVDEYLKKDSVPQEVKEILNLMVITNQSAAKKYKKMLGLVSQDGRIRDILWYHGATTGRYSGKGIQIQNFKSRGIISKDFEKMAEDIKTKNFSQLQSQYTDVMSLIASASRGVIIPPENKSLVVSDYSAIEARIVFWLCECEQALDIFRNDKCIYRDMASKIYKTTVDNVTNDQRQLGKQIILGLGYGMGFVKFLITLRGYDMFFNKKDIISIIGFDRYQEYLNKVLMILQPKKYFSSIELKEAEWRSEYSKSIFNVLKEVRLDVNLVLDELVFAKYLVDLYRFNYPEVSQYWKKLEQAYMQTAETGETTFANKISFRSDNVNLYAVLPSDREITYPNFSIDNGSKLSYDNNVVTEKRVTRAKLYGGKMLENVSQAIASDITTTSAFNMLKGGKYIPCLQVHDENGAWVDIFEEDIEEFNKLMVTMPNWAEGLPIKCETHVAQRYGKF